MKQGKATREVKESWKAEPKSKGGNPEGIDQMGQALAFKHRPIFEGPSFNPTTTNRPALGPGGGRTIYSSGSQGKHK